MSWKREEAAVVDGVWDMIGLVTVKELIEMICLLVMVETRVVDAGQRVCASSSA